MAEPTMQSQFGSTLEEALACGDGLMMGAIPASENLITAKKT